jgi:hypothetical protein
VKIYFPDTNFFFECRKASDLPWHELDGSAPGAGPDIQLIVPPTVIAEIDQHKAKGNSRTARRARDISARMREALLAPDQQAVLREADPRVVLQLPPVFKVDFSRYPDLDRERPDDRIAAECATMNVPDASFLTGYTLSALISRSISLSTVLIPDEWRLAPENDERDDTINKLQSELKGYKQTAPDITLEVLDASKNVVTELTCAIARYASTKSAMDAAISMVKARHPMKIDFNEPPPLSVPLMQMIGMLKPIKPEAISRYTNTDYPDWLKEVRAKLAELVPVYNRIAREFTFTVSLANSGFVHAENLTLYLDGFDGLLLLDALDEDDLQDRKKLLSLPTPPRPPTNVDPMWSGLTHLGRDDFDRTLISSYNAPRSRQPNKLYFSTPWPRNPVDHMELVCAALPHQQDATTRSFRAYVGEHLGGAPRLRVRVAASNVRKPIETFIRVKTSEMAGDFLSNLHVAGTI